MTKKNWERIAVWQGGVVSNLAARGALALAATQAGLFRSVNANGRDIQWQPQPIAVNHLQASAVAIAADGQIAFAATQAGALFESRDGAASWREIEAWHGNGVITTIALSPNFASDRTLFVATDHGPFRSLDGGATWQSADFGLMDAEILCLACAPNFSDSELLFAGSARGGLYRSRNAARAWRESGNGLPDAAVQCLLVSPNFADDKTVFAGLEESGLFVSTDGGATWSASGLQRCSVNALAWHKGEVWAGASNGLHASGDAGKTWRTVSGDDVLSLCAGEAGVFVGAWGRAVQLALAHELRDASSGLAAHVPPLAAQQSDGTLFMYAPDAGLARVESGPVTIVRAPFASEDVQTLGIARGANDEEQVLVVSEKTAHAFAPASNKWRVLSVEPKTREAKFIALAVSPSDAHRMLLGDTSGALVGTLDGGRKWTGVPSPVEMGELRQIVITGDDAVHVVAETAASDDGTRNAQVWRFEPSSQPHPKRAEEWTLLTTLTGMEGMWVALLTSEDALLIGAHNGVVHVTRDRAAAKLQGAPHEFGDDVRVTGLGRGPRGEVWAATNDGLFRSDDGGQSWTNEPAALAGRVISSLHAADGSLTAVAFGGEVWRAGRE